VSPFSISLALRSPYDGAAPAPRQLRSRVARVAAAGSVRTFLVSDALPGAGGPSSRELAGWVLESGGEPLVTLAAAGMPGTAFPDRLREWGRAGVRRFLLVTGNHPGGTPDAFEVDSTQMLMLARRGAADPGARAGELHAGAVITLGKTLESELAWQYARLRRKVEAGAEFIVAQAGYDPRAWDELARFCRLGDLGPSLIGSVLVPDEPLARRIVAGEVPGVTIHPALLERMLAREGRGGLRVAAAAVAALRGLGYHGALLCGRPLDPEQIAIILEEADRLQPAWGEFLAEFGPALPRFSFFREDARTGLNTDEPAPVGPRTRARLAYRFSEAVDAVAFDSRRPFARLLIRVCRFCDARPRWGRALWLAEYLSKVPLYGCRMCGDCTLYACGFLCAESGCAKRMVNGPCGGGRDGRCEVPGAGRCLWVAVYDRLKATAERPGLPAAQIPPKDRSLAGTCSWVSYCLGRDHRGRRPASP
jgi:methylenetetrahydrofolate reductase (NADPH)